jgi:hypothetical protein
MTSTLTPDERQVLELIATESGYPEHLLLEHGYDIYFLADLVRCGLASVTAERVDWGPTAHTVFWLCITNLGRKALRDSRKASDRQPWRRSLA